MSTSKPEKNSTETAPNYLVRTDPGSQKIDKFFSPNNVPSTREANITVSLETKYGSIIFMKIK